MCSLTLQLHPDDNVAICPQGLAGGANCGMANNAVLAREKVPPGHKIAIDAISAGAPIVKYGQTIGFANKEIETGSWVHVHNVVASRSGQTPDYAFSSEIHHPVRASTPLTFSGFRRRDGSAGTRNYVALISTVNCSATTARYVADELASTSVEEFPNIDGIIPFVHNLGCAVAYQGADHQQLQRTLAGIAAHPNIGARLILGLGCETNQAIDLAHSEQLVQLGQTSSSQQDLPQFLNIQDQGGVRRTVQRATEVLRELLPAANDVKREPIPLSELKVAMECGGSDSFSGITANPAVGVASDLLVSHGGTTILSETPEIYGAEHLLTRRAISRDVGEQLLERIRWWEDYARRHERSIDNNPSVGNKAGGLTTIYEKSLGAIAKAGTSPLMAVYRYAEPVSTRGFVIMDSPGYDPMSVTGKVAGGAQIVVFTTGRGSCFGCKPSPTIKVASNSALFTRMSEDMDIDAGSVLTGESVESAGQRVFDMIISTASGESTRSELQGIGDEEFCPWMPGPIF